jgi:phosphate transport system substrate-binding protein
MRRRLVIIGGMAALLAGRPGVARAEGFSGAGSTFAHPILGRWARAYATHEGEGGPQVSEDSDLAYEPVGSLGGVMRVIQGAVEFGVSDVPLPRVDIERQRLAQFPIVSGGVAVVANLPSIARGALRLNGDVLAGIYLGRITRWSDPAIRALNPGLALPDAPITVLRRQDGSGTTFHFAGYLAAASAEWRSRVGVDTTLNWPVGIGAKGNRELAELARSTPHAIGYVEAGLAGRLGLGVAALQNMAGQFVMPELANLRSALAAVAWNPAEHFYLARLEPTAADAYPIVATVYALIPRRPHWNGRTRMAIEFFRASLTERPADAIALGYVPLPPAVVRQVTEYWHATIRGAR